MQKCNEPCKDHLGVEFPSVYVMCKSHGVKYTTYRTRIDNGWSLDKALSTKLGYEELFTEENGFRRKNGCFLDHLDNPYVSVRSMCKCWHIYQGTFMQRVKSNHDLKYCLTKDNKVKTPDKDNKVIWVFGEPYATYNDIDEAYGFSGRISYFHRDDIEGWLKGQNLYKVDGNEYGTRSEVAEYSGLTENCIKHRVEVSGMSLEEAVHVPLPYTSHGIQCQDHLGNNYDSIREMTTAWGISYGTYQTRIRSGWNVKDALTIPVKHYKSVKTLRMEDTK